MICFQLVSDSEETLRGPISFKLGNSGRTQVSNPVMDSCPLHPFLNSAFSYFLNNLKYIIRNQTACSYKKKHAKIKSDKTDLQKVFMISYKIECLKPYIKKVTANILYLCWANQPFILPYTIHAKTLNSYMQVSATWKLPTCNLKESQKCNGNSNDRGC